MTRRTRTDEEKANRPIEEMLRFPRGGVTSLRKLAMTDLDLVAALVALRDDIDQAVTDVVCHHVAEGASWREVGVAAGLTRWAAQKRWGHLVTSTRSLGGQPAQLR